MLLAAVLGGLIGFEREWSNHAAGFRTHIQVCLGSASIMLLSIYGFSQFVDEVNVRIDPARLAAQVISGIGFLGAGAILRNGNMIKGLTTAASIWVVAAIGLCVGAGFFLGAIMCTLIVLINLFVFNKWERIWAKKRRYHDIEMVIQDQQGVVSAILSKFQDFDIKITDIKMHHTDVTEIEASVQPSMTLKLNVLAPHVETCMRALEEIMMMNAVESIETSMKGETLTKVNLQSANNQSMTM
ncbi:MgtC/SapB family protein [Paenibacillus sp. GCM10028914]|uniref:MgtC/SapB family protein n=1 Tax=Paenibacillus sp. GCM10028914 TaxID=3273416 RepID=UPI003614AEFC